MTRKRKISEPNDHQQSAWALPVVAVILLAFGAGVFMLTRSSVPNERPSEANGNSTSPSVTTDPGNSQIPSQLLSMEVAKAVMVTADLEFPEGMPTIAAALSQIERRYQPADGIGRTFSILDAYGESSSDGKLHISMHVSSEKPGLGSLIFKRTGEVLWNSKITIARLMNW